MSDVEKRFHEQWIGMVQPIEGLVVSTPVLVDAQCMERQPPDAQARLHACAPLSDKGARALVDVRALFEDILGWDASTLETGEAVREDASIYVPEGGQLLRPTHALRASPNLDTSAAKDPASAYVALVWVLPPGTPLDRNETATGPWSYPASAKLDRLLRGTRVPIGLLVGSSGIRLTYAPHGESSGSITFRIDDMGKVDGRPIFDAFVALLHARRFYLVQPTRALPAILADSRKRQANVTNALASQVFEAIQHLLAGFEAAAERDGDALLRASLERDEDHVYAGLLTVLLRLVFCLYAEDRSLLPVEHPLYQRHYSVLGLFEDLQDDRAAFPDSMHRRFGAWGRLVATFRAIYLGVRHRDLTMPPRHGDLFDPHRFPFLEGWGPEGSAPVNEPEAQGDTRLPSLDDGTVHAVLERLLLLDGQRLSYRALDVEQIGSVYEALMGYHVLRVVDDAVCIGPSRVWITAPEVMAVAPAQRVKWLKETAGLATAQADKLAKAITDSKSAPLEALLAFRLKGTDLARAGRLVLQPGEERRRTSSHYTPRSLTEPIVARTLDPLLACMGNAPASERILSLKVCDPAMGSGAFLVAACRYLADAVVAAWTREGKLADLEGDPVLHARRLVAQRCLYGVDRNPYAVSLAKLSLWLVTLARELPFTFLDHSLRHGDSLVGLDFDQIRAFHWKPSGQVELASSVLTDALGEAIRLRQQIAELAANPDPVAQREKERLLWDAEDALSRARLIGDLVIGAFFAHDKDKEREKERVRRLERVSTWMHEGGDVPEELLAMQAALRARTPVFHWMLEMPEVFFAERPDPLEDEVVNRAAFMDAFVGNPPFAGKNAITSGGGSEYLDWLLTAHAGSHGNSDLSAHFFRGAARLLGKHGTIGLIATNTIAQGDTRSTGLQRLVADGFTIYDATRSMMWPGDAAVSVSIVHLSTGRPSTSAAPFLVDGARVREISSQLQSAAERPDAAVLRSNTALSFQGSIVLGMGFTLTPFERERLIEKDTRNAQRIFPYLGGQEINSSPTHSHDRFTINFGQMGLEDAEGWPDLIGILRAKVKVERDQLKDNADGAHRKKYWWQFGRYTPALFSAVAPLERCLANSRVSKHLVFAFQPTDRVFAESLYVYPLPAYTSFAVLQSRIHEPWARLLSSSMKNDLRYAASDCFETFPFPAPDPRTVIASVEEAGRALYEARAAYMVETQQGLTQTYNRLKDPREHAAPIVALRALHEAMDRAVLDAYGWTDLVVPPFCPKDDGERAALEAFSAEVIDRLYALNAVRAAEETASAPAVTKGSKKGGGAKKRPKGDGSSGQSDLDL